MSSGFSGSGGPDFYSSGGINARSVVNNAQPPYRSPQLQGVLVDPASQIVHRRPDLIGKRPLADFQTQTHHQFVNQHYQYQQQQRASGNLGMFLRSVKPRTYYNTTSPISPLSPVDFSAAISPEMISSVSSTLAPQPPPGRYGLSLLRPMPNAPAPSNGVVPSSNPAPEEKKMMDQQLQELEKQLLLDDDEDDNKTDSVSVITGSEWSGAIVPNFLSPSPTSSTTSSSSSSSVASPQQACPKQSLLDAASAAADGNAERALEILARVAQAADAKGRSDQRMAAHMAAGLRRRVSRSDGPPPVHELYGLEHAAAMQKLCEFSPCFQLGLWAANQAILDATSDLPEKIHVVDFEGLHGAGALQYLFLVQLLAARQTQPLALRITCVAEQGGGNNGACEELRKLGVKLSFVSLGLGDLSRDSLGCDPDEALVVNLAYKLFKMPDESVRTDNPRDELLRRVKGLGPRVVAIVEQEMNGNTAPFVARVGEVCSYYGALFDSLDSTMARDNSDRLRVEEGLGRKMANSVACEGKDRLERCEMFGKWRARLRMAGFEQRPLSQSVAESLLSRVNSAPRGNVGYTVKEENGAIWFGWMGRTLTVASSWR